MDKKNKPTIVSLLGLCLGIVLTTLMIFVIQKHTQQVLKEELRDQLTEIAGTAVLSLKVPSIERSIPTFNKTELKKVAGDLRAIRDVKKEIKYIYILLPTKKSGEMKFLVDADTFNPIDWNKNNVIDEDEIPPDPGENYDAADSPMLEVARNMPTADFELTQDQWGTFLSGYAPIKNEYGDTVAVLGVDVDVTDYLQIIQSTLLPFILLTLLLILVLILQTLSLVKIWNNRVKLVEELDKQKDELLSIVSHQLAAPVTSIKWYLELLLDGDTGKLTDDQATTLKSMQTISADLADLVSMILDVSRIQLGRMRIDAQPLNLKEFFTEILDVIEPKAKEKPVHFVVEMPETLPTVLLDKRLTRMTVENLLTNAVKYTPKDGDVTFKVQLRPDNTMYVEVRDTGCGIPQKDQDKIFGKQFRASNVRNTIDGNGFGLYVAKGAIESQHGKIWFESEEGKGTAFFITLPLKAPEEKANEASKAQ